MKILIVEDDPHKLDQLIDELDLLNDIESIDLAASLQQAIATLEANTFDIVLLDMAIPSHDGDAGSTDIYSQPVGGLDVLLYLSAGSRSDTVIIVTQYPSVEYNREHVPLDRLLGKFASDDIRNVREVILFGDDQPWRGKLQKALAGHR